MKPEERYHHPCGKEHYAKLRKNQFRTKAVLEREFLEKFPEEKDFLFGKGTFNERRLICETVFKNLYVKEGRITRAELNAPFASIAASSKGSKSVLHGGRYWI